MRRCSACEHEKRERRKFCDSYAARLATVCSAYGTANEPALPHPGPSQTPADKILQTKSALEGERKQVTVLFADVKGSMNLAEQVDPDEWHKIMDRFFGILSDGVHRFE